MKFAKKISVQTEMPSVISCSGLISSIVRILVMLLPISDLDEFLGIGSGWTSCLGAASEKE